MYGVWATNEEKYKQGQPFEISMQGMGLCSFEKRISQHSERFGAEEGYIAEYHNISEDLGQRKDIYNYFLAG